MVKLDNIIYQEKRTGRQGSWLHPYLCHCHRQSKKEHCCIHKSVYSYILQYLPISKLRHILIIHPHLSHLYCYNKSWYSEYILRCTGIYSAKIFDKLGHTLVKVIHRYLDKFGHHSLKTYFLILCQTRILIVSKYVLYILKAQSWIKRSHCHSVL